jgi:predicted O-methyltransferase YrrM
MHKLEHLTPRYVVDRLRVFTEERRHPDWPWLTRDAILFLSSWLKPADVGFEWGSGRSTAWFAGRVGHLTSVEHHPAWAETVQAMLTAAGCTEKVDYHLETDAELVHEPNSRYLHVIDKCADNSLDFCLVDGWQRVDCCLAAIAKVKPGGLLILDNAELYVPRAQPSRAVHARSLMEGFPTPSDLWRSFFDQTALWRSLWTTNGIGDTAVYVKPEVLR